MKLYIIGIIGQWLGCLTMGLGIALEIVYRAHFGYIALSIGSALYAILTKVKAVGKEIEIKELKAKIRKRLPND